MTFTCFAIAFIAHKHIETIEEHLANCSYVKTIRDVYSNAGRLGKVMRDGIIGALLLVPALSARRDLVDAQEVESLPMRYKNLLRTPPVVGSALFLLLITLQVLIYFIVVLSKNQAGFFSKGRHLSVHCKSHQKCSETNETTRDTKARTRFCFSGHFKDSYRLLGTNFQGRRQESNNNLYTP